jgi:hypothetical protein
MRSGVLRLVIATRPYSIPGDEAVRWSAVRPLCTFTDDPRSGATVASNLSRVLVSVVGPVMNIKSRRGEVRTPTLQPFHTSALAGHSHWSRWIGIQKLMYMSA